MRVLKTPAGDEPAVLIEIEDVAIHEISLSSEDAEGGDVEGKTEDALNKLRDIGRSIADVCRSLHEEVKDSMEAAQPDEFVLEFGVKVSAEGSAIIAKATGEASLKVTAKWVKA